MAGWQLAVLCVYSLIVIFLSLYGFHRYFLLRLHRRHRHDHFPPLARFDELPQVTVQLPLYNEYHVVDRLLAAVGRLDYPRDKLQIQVLDDSTDDTQQRARAATARLRSAGVDAEYRHRVERVGYKAGALEAGLHSARGQFVLVLDADFLPQPQILLQAIQHFTDPQIGMVQLRWGHINRGYSLLTRLQSIFLDGHFMVEHFARHHSGRFFNFNGTAGIWRRRAIEDAGGWQHDTLTEDLDLSYRAQLAGWRFRYLPDIAVPGELPVEMNAFKAQQFRWAKGAAQTARKLLPRIWRSNEPLAIRLEATFHLTANLTYIPMLFMALLMLPVLSIRSQLGWERLLLVDLPLFSFATMAVSGYYLASQQALYPRWWRQIRYLPLLLALGMSLCVNNTRGVLEGLLGHDSPFVRTPKYGVDALLRHPAQWRYKGKVSVMTLAEFGMAAYFAIALGYAWETQLYLGLPFLLLFHCGFLYTAIMSSAQPWLSRLQVPSLPGKAALP
jgi:cellulose synthase/poly-beta-1,6-N-acetylglucosamine synthase-like glycosyltransferase